MVKDMLSTSDVCKIFYRSMRTFWYKKHCNEKEKNKKMIGINNRKLLQKQKSF